MPNLIGYGSYLNSRERAREGFPEDGFQLAYIKGYQRIMNKVSESGRWPRVRDNSGEWYGVMNVRRTDEEILLPVLVIEVDGEALNRSNEREGVDSETHDIQHYTIEETSFYSFENPEEELGTGLVYIANPSLCRRDVKPVPRYYRVCLQGAAEHGEEFLQKYAATTIVQWNGAEITVEMVERYNRFPGDLRVGLQGDQDLVDLFKAILDLPTTPTNWKYAANIGLLRKIYWGDQEYSDQLWEDIERKRADLGSIYRSGAKYEIVMHGGLKDRPEMLRFVVDWLIRLWFGKFDANTEELVRITDSEAEELTARVIDHLVLNGEVLENQIKRGRYVDDLEDVNEIIVRPLEKLDRIDGEILIRRQLIKMLSGEIEWIQRVWKISKMDPRTGNLYTYYKMEHQVHEPIYMRILLLRDHRRRMQKTKTFDDGETITYMTSPRSNYTDLGPLPEPEVPEPIYEDAIQVEAPGLPRPRSAAPDHLHPIFDAAFSAIDDLLCRETSVVEGEIEVQTGFGSTITIEFMIQADGFIVITVEEQDWVIGNVDDHEP